MHEKEEIFTRLKTLPVNEENLKIIKRLEGVEPTNANLINPGFFEMLYFSADSYLCLEDYLRIEIKWYPGDDLIYMNAKTPEFRIGLFYCPADGNWSCLYKKNRRGRDGKTFPSSLNDFWTRLSVILEKIQPV